jgi:hypothetical protein
MLLLPLQVQRGRNVGDDDRAMDSKMMQMHP